jgi:hypothetical protein
MLAIANTMKPTAPPMIGTMGMRALVVVVVEEPEPEPEDELEPEPEPDPVLVAPGPVVAFVPVAPTLVSADAVTAFC